MQIRTNLIKLPDPATLLKSLLDAQVTAPGVVEDRTVRMFVFWKVRGGPVEDTLFEHLLLKACHAVLLCCTTADVTHEGINCELTLDEDELDQYATDLMDWGIARVKNVTEFRQLLMCTAVHSKQDVARAIIRQLILSIKELNHAPQYEHEVG